MEGGAARQRTDEKVARAAGDEEEGMAAMPSTAATAAVAAAAGSERRGSMRSIPSFSRSKSAAMKVARAAGDEEEGMAAMPSTAATAAVARSTWPSLDESPSMRSMKKYMLLSDGLVSSVL